MSACIANLTVLLLLLTFIDLNLTEIKKMVQYHNGSKAEEFLKHRYQCIKCVIFPLEDPV